jgi:hypothetical protein
MKVLRIKKKRESPPNREEPATRTVRRARPPWFQAPARNLPSPVRGGQRALPPAGGQRARPRPAGQSRGAGGEEGARTHERSVIVWPLPNTTVHGSLAHTTLARHPPSVLISEWCRCVCLLNVTVPAPSSLVQRRQRASKRTFHGSYVGARWAAASTIARSASKTGPTAWPQSIEWTKPSWLLRSALSKPGARGVLVSWAGRACQLGGACLSVGRGDLVAHRSIGAHLRL